MPTQIQLKPVETVEIEPESAVPAPAIADPEARRSVKIPRCAASWPTSIGSSNTSAASTAAATSTPISRASAAGSTSVLYPVFPGAGHIQP